MDPNSIKDDMFYLIAYMLTSARGLYGEPADYGIFRLLDSAGRLLETLESHELTDEYLATLKQEVDEIREGSMDNDCQRERLDQIVLAVAEEMKKRLGG